MKEKIRKTLVECGLVRVDGMTFFAMLGSNPEVVKPNPGNGIRHDFNNGKGVVALPEGEVWLGCHDGVQKALDSFRAEDISTIRSCFVPFSNGEHDNLGEILHRLTDPDFEF